jgi:hypothetical protein
VSTKAAAITNDVRRINLETAIRIINFLLGTAQCPQTVWLRPAQSANTRRRGTPRAVNCFAALSRMSYRPIKLAGQPAPPCHGTNIRF